MRRYSLSHGALNDIGLIVDYIAARNPPAARRLRDDLFGAFTLLAENPLIGHHRPGITDLPLRFWRVGSYLIVYSEAEPIEIVRVLHGRRNIAAELAQ
jgi:plasmid stabilization system protein ParE